LDPSDTFLLLQSPYLDPTFIFSALGMLVLLIVSALISGSEVAFFSLKPAELEEIRMAQDSGSERIIQLLEIPDRRTGSSNLLATILVINNFVNIIIILLSTSVVTTIFPKGSMNPILEVVIHIAAVTFLIVLFGEVIPKVYATNYGLSLAKIMSAPIQISQKIFWVFWKPLVSMGRVIDDRFNKGGSSSIDINTLSHALELTDSDDRTEEEKKILEGIVAFGSKDVKQIMTSRMDVACFDIELSYPELRKKILELGFSRIPVFRGTIDEVAGILYIKDLLPHLKTKDFNWTALIRPPFFVPENKKIDDLLREFQSRKNHMAIVVDEYGGTSGLITLEDVIEEIVGDITDEFDDDELQYSRIDDRNFIFEGKTALIDIYRILDIDGENFEQEKGESDTLAGFIIEQAGKIPLKGERIHFEQFTFTVEAADKRKVKRVKVSIEALEED
jgi:putative hemolysin